MFYLKCLLSSWILFQVTTQAWSEEVSPPSDVRFDSVVRWSPSTDQSGVKYTVQSKTDGGEWENIDGCVETEGTTCDRVSGLGCVMVRVWAQQGRHISESVQACSHAMSCSPGFQLTAKPGLLVVSWRKNHSLSDQLAGHFKYLVKYGREGEALNDESESSSSVILQDLEFGGRYCVHAQYVCYNKPFGIPSPTQCASIPESERTTHIRITLISVFIPVLLGTVAVGLIFLFYRHHEKIKQLRPRPLRLPDHYCEFFNGDFGQLSTFLTSPSGLSEEHHDTISIVLYEDDQVDTCPNPTVSGKEQ